MWPKFNEPVEDQNSNANALGMRIHSALKLNEPVGKWTGLDPRAGAPLSGALWGAGAGLTYAGLRKLFHDPEEDEEEPSILMPTVLGAAAGLGLGAWSGHMQHEKRTSYGHPSIDQAIRTIQADRTLSTSQISQIVHELRKSTPGQQRRILGMLATGGLTALAASKVLGMGLLGAALTGGAAAYTFNNWTRQPREV